MPTVQKESIVEEIKGRKGLCSKRPEGSRAYYVWRMARFHGGADVTMPVVASVLRGNDPFVKELDALAELVAKKVFGTDMAAALRWGSALGFLNQAIPAGLPGSAYPNGPVVLDGNKPVAESLEIAA